MKAMKRRFKITAVAAVLLALFIQQANAGIIKKQDPQDYITVKGTIVDSKTNSPLIFATISVQGSNVATVTNLDGEFILKVTKAITDPNLEIMYIGYNNKVIPLNELRTEGRNNNIQLDQAVIPIQEVVIKPVTPEEILQAVIYNISQNYTEESNLMTSFYRETIRRNRNYVSIAEAVVEVFKAPCRSK